MIREPYLTQVCDKWGTILRGVEVKLQVYLTSALDASVGHLHATASLSLAKKSPITTRQEAGWAPDSVWKLEKAGNWTHFTGCPSHSLDAISTEHSRPYFGAPDPFLGNGSVNTFLLLGSRFLIMQQLHYNNRGAVFSAYIL
jgi:hypothetical protein